MINSTFIFACSAHIISALCESLSLLLITNISALMYSITHYCSPGLVLLNLPHLSLLKPTGVAQIRSVGVISSWIVSLTNGLRWSLAALWPVGSLLSFLFPLFLCGFFATSGLQLFVFPHFMHLFIHLISCSLLQIPDTIGFFQSPAIPPCISRIKSLPLVFHRSLSVFPLPAVHFHCLPGSL